MKKILGIVFILLVIVAILQMVTQKHKNDNHPHSHKPVVAVSTFALYDIAKHIAPESMELFMIMPAGVDAHSFEPTPKLMVKYKKVLW